MIADVWDGLRVLCIGWRFGQIWALKSVTLRMGWVGLDTPEAGAG